MAKLLLLTDSNYINNSRSYLGPKIKNLQVVSCQNKASLMSELAGVREGIVVVACLDLIASEAAAKSIKSAQDAAVELAFNHVLWKAMDLLEEAEGRLALGLVPPIFWRDHSKLTVQGLHHAYMLAQKSQPSQLWIPDYMSGMIVGRDQVHLVPQAGRKYVEQVHELFRKIDQDTGYGLVDFESPDFTLVPEVEKEMSWEDGNDGEDQGTVIIPPSQHISPTRTLSNVSASMLRSAPSTLRSLRSSAQAQVVTGSNAVPIENRSMVPSNHSVRFSVPPPTFAPRTTPALQPSPPVAWPTMMTPDLTASLSRIEQRLGILESKSLQDNFMMAALKEEHDSAANRAMLDRLNIIGIRIQNIKGMKDEERNPIMKQKVESLVSKLREEGQEIEVVFVRHLNRQARNPENTVLEVRFKSEQQAGFVRANFIKKKESPDFENINITPTVRLATRVRVELIQAVARVIKQEDSMVSKTQCLQFVPKPILKVFRKDRRGTEYSTVMTFIDCVVWVMENDLEKKLDLKWAYKRAGSAFKGTLNQHFVLMS